MKITIDTDNKIIELESNVCIKDFIKTLEKLISNYEEYTLQVKSTCGCNQWSYIPYYPYYPYYLNGTTFLNSGNTATAKDGITFFGNN